MSKNIKILIFVPTNQYFKKQKAIDIKSHFTEEKQKQMTLHEGSYLGDEKMS